MRIRLLTTCTILLLALAIPAHAQIVILLTNADPDWTVPVGYPALAGDDLTGTYTSAANEAVLRIRFCAAPWRVTVRRTDTTWDGDLQLSVMRTNGGTPAGNLVGGTVYQPVNTTDDDFFWVTTAVDVRNIRCRFQLTGVNATIGAQNFLTTVTYTVTEY